MSFVEVPGRRVARIANRFDHHHPHSCVRNPLVSVFHQTSPNSSSLMIWIDDQNVDLTHVVLRMNSSADPSNELTTVERDVNILGFAVENFRKVGHLPGLPTMGPECFVDEVGDAHLQLGKYRSPSAPGQVK